MKIYIVKISTAILCLMSALSSYGLSFDQNGLRYTLLSMSTVEVGMASNSSVSGELTIPQAVTNEGVKLSVVKIADGGFSNCSTINGKISIPSSVTEIGIRAFRNMPNVTEFELGNNVTTIGKEAFMNDTKLRTINLPSSLISIGEGAFCNNQSLEEISFPEGIVSLPKNILKDCIGLKHVSLPSTLKKIEGFAFANCGITSLQLPSGITKLDAFSLCNASSLRTVDLPENFSSFGESAFRGCSSLETVAIPEKVTTLPKALFKGCNSLKKIIIPSTITVLADSIFAECGTKLATPILELDIQSPITSIENQAWFYQSKLKRLKLPSTLKSLGKYCFASCQQIDELKIPDSVTELGVSCFAYCTFGYLSLPSGITSLYLVLYAANVNQLSIPGSVKSIQGSSFMAAHIKKLIFEEGVEIFDNYALYCLLGVEEIYLPSTLKSVGVDVFYTEGCPDIYYAGKTPLICSVNSIKPGIYKKSKLHVSPNLKETLDQMKPWYLFENISYDYNVEINPESVPNIKTLRKAGLFYYVTSESDKTVCVTWDGSNQNKFVDYTVPYQIPISGIYYDVTNIPECGFSGCKANVLYLPRFNPEFSVNENAFRSCVIDEWAPNPSKSNRFKLIGDVDVPGGTGYYSDGWVTDIKQISTTSLASVEDIFDSDIHAPQPLYYDLNGLKLDISFEDLPSGIYIVKKGNDVIKIRK